MAHDAMTAADAVFLRIETLHEPQHVGSLSLFAGDALRNDTGAIDLDALRAHVSRRLDRVPRLRQRVMEVPFGQGRPVWVDDVGFDIEYHVRLERVHTQTSELKGSVMVDGAQTILELADTIPRLAPMVTRFVSRQIPMNLVVTNVPGPPIPLYLRGAPLVETYPYVEVLDNEGLTIAVVSYADTLFFGITGDRDVMYDIADLATAIAVEFDELAAS